MIRLRLRLLRLHYSIHWRTAVLHRQLNRLSKRIDRTINRRDNTMTAADPQTESARELEADAQHLDECLQRHAAIRDRVHQRTEGTAALHNAEYVLEHARRRHDHALAAFDLDQDDVG